MELSTILKITRQKAFMTQELFANELSVTASTINRWEHGKAKPSLTAMKNLKRFCDEHELDYKSIENEWLRCQNEM